MKDVIIVGSGIAGCSLAWQLDQLNKSFVMISDFKPSSSAAAAGVYNPVILKRFTPVWQAQQQLHSLHTLYNYIQQKSGLDHRNNIPIARRMHDARELSTWVKKSQRVDLAPYMQSQVDNLSIHGINADHGYGMVTGTGWVDTISFMQSSYNYFKQYQLIINDTFNHDKLLVSDDCITYNQITARHIVFAQGYSMRHNPYFNYLPLQGNKGEVLLIKVPGLQLDYIIKSSVFIMPYRDDLFWVGATYNRHDLTDHQTQDGLEYLTTRLDKFLTLPYTIVDHKHGIRPTTIDRRPFVGAHHTSDKVWIFNGMGSRAVLIAPWAATQLTGAMFNQSSINPEMDINRFTTAMS